MIADATKRCGDCAWYAAMPKNLNQGICYLDPPAVTGIPMQGPVAGTMQLKAAALERSVPRARPACQHSKRRGGGNDAKGS